MWLDWHPQPEGHNKKEEREVRMTCFRMLLRLSKKLDEARLARVMSIAVMYVELDKDEEQAMLQEFREQFPEEGEEFMELRPVWQKWAYEEGMEKGIE
ncbi:hypothetical protein [Paenibacillus filicis]